VTLTVLLVDDHDLIRDGLTAVFSVEPDMEVVGVAATVAEAVDLYDEHHPQVVVTDLQLQDGTGLDVIRHVRGDSADVGLVVLTMHSGDEQIFASLEAGASAFVGKDAPSAEVVKAARNAAISPGTFTSAGLVDAVVRRTSASTTRLSDRELEVLRHLADGSSTAEIASQLYLSESTVKSHVQKVYQKLGAANRAQALVTAMRIGLLPSSGGPPLSGPF
jgi:DNA-binding NarL/FixJ family response regulator